MKTGRDSRDRFYMIIEQTDIKRKDITEQTIDEFIRHLIHDELDNQERLLVEEYHLYDWHFQED